MERDLEALVRASWEAKEAGRAERAKAGREKWLSKAPPEEEPTEDQLEEKRKTDLVVSLMSSRNHANDEAKEFVRLHVEAPSTLVVSEPYNVLPLDADEAERRKAWLAEDLEATSNRWDKLYAEMEASMELNKEHLEALKSWRDNQPWGKLGDKCAEKRDLLRQFFGNRDEKVGSLKVALFEPTTETEALQTAYDEAVAAEAAVTAEGLMKLTQQKLRLVEVSKSLEEHLAKKEESVAQQQADAEAEGEEKTYREPYPDPYAQKEISALLFEADELKSALQKDAENPVPVGEGLDTIVTQAYEMLQAAV